MPTISATDALTQPAGPSATPSVRVRAIDPAALRELRACDDARRAPLRLTDDEGGSPLRCCLRRSRLGEQIALVAYAPLRRWAEQAGVDPGPYAEVGPVFIHAEACPGPGGDGFPPEYLGGHWVLRAYRADGRIRGGRLVEADQTQTQAAADAALAGQLADPDVAFVHVRAVEFGCFQFEARRG